MIINEFDMLINFGEPNINHSYPLFSKVYSGSFQGGQFSPALPGQLNPARVVNLLRPYLVNLARRRLVNLSVFSRY